jgi:hypothetical protein
LPRFDICRSPGRPLQELQLVRLELVLILTPRAQAVAFLVVDRPGETASMDLFFVREPRELCQIENCIVAIEYRRVKGRVSGTRSPPNSSG